jgi:metal-dependent amidase/aminoacylase/carboxypeptidase family protein
MRREDGPVRGAGAHAGGMPHRGINALYAAQIGLMAINAVRETFRDEDTVRVHPIMTHGGSQVNVIPADVRLETFVRAKTLEAIADADRKVDRALRAGALALGATVEIETLPGYMPMRCDPTLVERFRPIAERLVGAEHVRTIAHRTGSTDMGDLAQVMPVIHPYVGGASGTSHGADWQLVDQSLVYLTNAKVLASMVVDLLADGAAAGKEVVAKAKPPMTRQGYLEFQRAMSRREVFEGDR